MYAFPVSHPVEAFHYLLWLIGLLNLLMTLELLILCFYEGTQDVTDALAS